MIIIHAVVIGIRQSIDAPRTVEAEWPLEKTYASGANYTVKQFCTFEDNNNEFAIGDKVSITVNKIM